MRLKNYGHIESIKQTKTVELAQVDGVPIELLIQDLPPTYGDELEAALPTPQPPVLGPLKDGGRVMFGDDGRPLLRHNESDPGFRKAIAEHRTLSLMFFVTEGVAPNQLEFEAVRGDDSAAYYRAVLEEMKAFGFGIGQVTRIANAVRELSGITDEDVEKATRDFSSPDEG